MRRTWLLLTLILVSALNADATTFATTLRGTDEFPNPGALDGSGIAAITIEDTGVSWAIYVAGIGTPTGVEIRKGKLGQIGTPAVTIGSPPFFNGFASGFSPASTAVVADMLAHPGDFFLNVSTASYPAGALRGQLDAGAAGIVAYTAVLSGRNQVPVATTREIAGASTVSLSGTSLRYMLLIDGVLTPTGAVLWRGLPGTIGAPVLDLHPTFDGRTANGIVTVSATLADEIRANPGAFYVNVTSVDFPDGAIRGQLAPTDPVTIYIPTVVKSAGLNDTSFVSDLRIYNPSSKGPATLRIDYFEASAGLGAPTATKTIQVPETAQAVIDDVLGTLFAKSGSGALRISSDRYVSITSRVLNDLRPVGGGTTGLLVPGSTFIDATRDGSLLLLSQASSEDASAKRGYRTNIGYFNPSASPIHLKLVARKNDGVAIGTVDLTVAGYARAQQAVFDLIPSVPIGERAPASFYLTYSADGPVFVYAAVVDNKTGDGIYVPAAVPR